MTTRMTCAVTSGLWASRPSSWQTETPLCPRCTLSKPSSRSHGRPPEGALHTQNTTQLSGTQQSETGREREREREGERERQRERERDRDGERGGGGGRGEGGGKRERERERGREREAEGEGEGQRV